MTGSFPIVLLFLTAIIAGLSIQLCYAQGSNIKTIQLGSSLQNGTEVHTLNVTDFSLKYPIGWNVYYSSPSREFESYTLEHPVNGSIEILIAPFEIQENNDSDLPQIFPWIIDTIQSGFENGVPSNPEEISFDKYAVDGYKMGSAQFNVSYKDHTGRVLVIANDVHNKGFVLTYSAPFSVFNDGLPTIEEIIKTIKIKE